MSILSPSACNQYTSVCEHAMCACKRLRRQLAMCASVIHKSFMFCAFLCLLQRKYTFFCPVRGEQYIWRIPLPYSLDEDLEKVQFGGVKRSELLRRGAVGTRGANLLTHLCALVELSVRSFGARRSYRCGSGTILC